jgi:hypothetical protein
MADQKGPEPQKTLEMRVAELEDKLSKIHITEDEMKAYQKVVTLLSGGQAGGGAAVGPQTGFICAHPPILPCSHPIAPCFHPIAPCSNVCRILPCFVCRVCIGVCVCFECGGGCLPGGGAGSSGGGFGSLGM